MRAKHTLATLCAFGALASAAQAAPLTLHRARAADTTAQTSSWQHYNVTVTPGHCYWTGHRIAHCNTYLTGIFTKWVTSSDAFVAAGPVMTVCVRDRVTQHNGHPNIQTLGQC